MLTEDYPRLGEYTADYMKYNTGIMTSSPPFFQAEVSYSGRAYSRGTSTFMGRDLNTRVNVHYEDLVADVQLKQ